MKLSVMTLPLLPAPDIPGLKQERKPKKLCLPEMELLLPCLPD